MPQAPKQGLSGISLGPSGPGAQGPNAAVQAVQQQADIHARNSQQAIQKIMQMQQAQADQAAMQAQQMQSGVMNVANQVASGIDKMHEERRREREKVEGVQLQEDMLVFQQQLQQEAGMEAQRIGTLMKQAQESTANEIASWREKGVEMKTDLQTTRSQFAEMVKSGQFRSMPDGYKRMDEIWKSLRNAESYVDDHTDPAYTSHAINLMHQSERDIVEGRDPMDLASLYDKPKTSGLAQITDTGTPLADPDGEMRFQDSLRGGYPKDGIYSITEDDPRRATVKLVTPTSMARALVDNATYTSLISSEARQKFVQSRMRMLDDEARTLVPMAENYEKVSNMMFSRANEAVRRGVSSFATNPNVAKFGNTPKAVVDNILLEMFPETPGIVEFATGVRDRTLELDTSAEFASVMTLEAAAAAIEKRVIGALTGIVSGPAKGKDEASTTVLSQMAEQWASTMPPQQVTQVLGEGSVDKTGTLSGVGMVRAQSHIQGLLEQAMSYAGELRDSANSQGAIQGYREALGDNVRMTDLYLWMHNQQSAENKERAQKMLLGQFEGQADQMSLSELQDWNPTVNEQAQGARSILDNLLEYTKAIGPDQLPRVAALLSGGQVDLTDGRVQTLNAARQSAEERSSYLQLTKEQLKDRREMAKMAKDARANGTPIPAEQMLAETRMRQGRRLSLAEKLRAIDEGQVGLGDMFQAGLSNLGQRTSRGYAKIGAGLGAVGSAIGRNFSKGMTILTGDE